MQLIIIPLPSRLFENIFWKTGLLSTWFNMTKAKTNPKDKFCDKKFLDISIWSRVLVFHFVRLKLTRGGKAEFNTRQFSQEISPISTLTDRANQRTYSLNIPLIWKCFVILWIIDFVQDWNIFDCDLTLSGYFGGRHNSPMISKVPDF